MPFVSVLHPSDLSETSENAFAHALAISLIEHSRLTLVHALAKKNEKVSWHEFPGVRQTLETWGLLKPGTPRSEVFKKIDIDVNKVILEAGKPLKETLIFLERHPIDLLVLATEGRDGIPQWLHPSFAEQLARKAVTMTLFIPKLVKGFVSPEDGHLSIRRLLIPIDHRPNPNQALVSAARLADDWMIDDLEITLLYVGAESDMPSIQLPKDTSIHWSIKNCQGIVTDQILKACESEKADLIIMATQGHQGFLDALRGSVTEQVIRHATCPILAVPVNHKVL